MKGAKKFYVFNVGSQSAPYAAEVRKGNELLRFTAETGRALLKLVRKYTGFPTSLYKEGHLVAVRLQDDWIY